MFRPLSIVLMVTALLGGCASYYDPYDDVDVYGYGNSYGYDDDYVVDEVVYGGHSYGGYGGYGGAPVGGFVGGGGFGPGFGSAFGPCCGFGYAHDPYWRVSAFSLFYQDFPSYYVWSPYRRIYPGFGHNFGFGFGNTFFGPYRYADFGFGHFSPFYGYTYRPRFSYFGFFSPTYYSPTYYYDFGHRDRRVVVRSPRVPSARNEARRLAGNSGPSVFGNRVQTGDRLRAKQSLPLGAANSRTASNRRTQGVGSPGNRATAAGSRASRAIANSPRGTGASRSGRAAGRAFAADRGTVRGTGRSATTRGAAAGASPRVSPGVSPRVSQATRSQASRQRAPEAGRSTRVLTPQVRNQARSTDRRSAAPSGRSSSTLRQRTGPTGRPVKIEQGGRSLVTRPTARGQVSGRNFSSRQQTRSRPAQRSTGAVSNRSAGFAARSPVGRTRPVQSTMRSAPRPTSRPNVRSTAARKPAAAGRAAPRQVTTPAPPQSRSYRPTPPRQPARPPAPRTQQRAPAPRQSARSAPPRRSAGGRSRSGGRDRN